MVETPPRAWGRLFKNMMIFLYTGNTPTGVGKTIRHRSPGRVDKKHPHGRGEDLLFCLFECSFSETPPRAWGRPNECFKGGRWSRNTPTGVGKTGTQALTPLGHKKHPHGRGEDAKLTLLIYAKQETPPRAWGRPDYPVHDSTFDRNTPTGVGKTFVALIRESKIQKHPHGRGEDSPPPPELPAPPETPPRAWGRLNLYIWLNTGVRNTPTGVGKTAALRFR